jgi:hypothetical protein
VQGALTPLRPGAVRPVGGGIDYAVTYDPAGGGPTGGRPWWSVHLGYGFPLGSFDNDFDSGPSAALDLEIPLSASWSLLGLLGYHSFEGGPSSGGDLSYTNLSLAARRYFPGSPWTGFVEAGPGIYLADPGADELGLNLGLGADRLLQPNLFLELAVDGHWVDPGGSDRAFLDARIGFKLRF